MVAIITADTTGTSAPWTGTTIGDAGAYGADTWSQIWSQVVGFDADENNVGVCRGIEDELEVQPTSPASQQVNVATGAALVQGKWYYTGTAVPFTIAANGLGGNRLDLIVLQIDYVTQKVRLGIIQGSVIGVEPTPTQVAGTLWEVPLALITVASPLVSITAADIEDRRDWCNIPDAIGLQIENNSAIVYEKGSVVVHNSPLAGYPLDTTTTTTAGSAEIAGVVITPIAIGAQGRMITYGITPVLCDELVAVGDYLECSTTAGQAQIAVSTLLNGTFARVLVANTGAGTKCLALVDMSYRSYRKIVVVEATFWYSDAGAYLTLGDFSGPAADQARLAYTNFRAPDNMTALRKATVIGIPTGGVGGGTPLTVTTDYGANGEAYNTHSGSVTTANVAAGDNNLIKEYSISSGLASLAAGDEVGVAVTYSDGGVGSPAVIMLKVYCEFEVR